MSTYNQKPNELIEKTAEKLKQVEQINPPEWSSFVKTSTSRDRPPVEKDWWYSRAASILRKLDILGPIGTNKLKRKYGGRKNRGHKPEKFFKGSGKIIRTILNQLEQAGLAEKKEAKGHKGRVLTKKGKSFLDTVTK
tara:strand:+ start:1845 stop:2255 length:411 start_codon:yes stop_codon:yes gene_type:complete